MKYCLTIICTLLASFSFGQIIITEIMYNPPESGTDSLEYIEFYNAGNEDIDLAGYFFSDGVSGTISEGTISAGGYFVASVNARALQTVFGVSSVEWESGALNNAGEEIELSAPDSSVVHFLIYDDSGDWPSEADGEGPSIELIENSLDNSLGINWKSSTKSTNIIIDGAEVFGSPGAPNGPLASVVKIADHLISIYPNPASNFITLNSYLNIESVEIISLSGNILLKQKGHFENQSVDISNIPNGMHLLRITTTKGIWQGSFVKIK